MDELTFRRNDESHTIILKRGGQDITFQKSPDVFAVRLLQGRAVSPVALEVYLGQPAVELRHVESVLQERMEVFRAENAVQLEETMDRLRLAPNADIITHLYIIDETPGTEVIPTGTIMIQFKPNLAITKQENILTEFGLEVIEDLDFLPNGYTVGLTGLSTENPLKIAAKLQKRDGIELAEPDLSVPISFEYEPTDPLYRDQWHLDNWGDRLGLEKGADVKANAAWNHTRGSRNVTICIMDDGFDLGHQDFNTADKIVAPRDFGQNDLDPSPTFWNDSHGTACAGVALAEENGSGVVGLAPNCAFMPLRMAGISDNAIVNYFQYAIDHGADIISCSWSARPWNFPLSAKMSGIIHKAATQGRNGKGIVILFAAGNQNRPLKGIKDGRVSHQGFALHPEVIAVGASNSLDKRSKYSNFGPELTLCAPSSGSPGRSIVTTDRRGIFGYSLGDYTNRFGGTSSATPLAAGLAGLILSVNPELTAAEIKQIMVKTADQIDTINGQYQDGRSPWYGAGRINAHQAIQYVYTEEQPLSTDVDEAPPARDDLQVEVLSIELSSNEAIPTHSEELLEAMTIFEVSGIESAVATTHEIIYCVEVSIFNREKEETNLVATSAGNLNPNTTQYTSRSEFPMPDIGRYELQSRVSLQFPSGVHGADHTYSRAFRINPRKH